MMNESAMAARTEALEPDYVFDLDGGRACLDFANSLSSSSGEHLRAYVDLLAFAEQSELITRADADWLRATAIGQPDQAEAVMARAYRLRSAIYAIFSAIAADQQPPDGELDALNSELALALQHACVEPHAPIDGYRYGWSGRELDMPLWGICRSAAETLTSPEDRLRVRECGGEDCRWLFIDSSRNRSRQWCSMSSCGNRQKAKRHYQRVRARSRT
jgi:predicted RNA-binding Zn ribbon-like protein